MKTFNKSFLPEKIMYNGKIFVCNYSVSADINIQNKSVLSIENEAIAITGHKNIILVNVLSKNLRGKTDLHGNNYKPSRWIFTPQS